MRLFGWEWDNGSKAHFSFGLAAGALGFGFSVLFSLMFGVVEILDFFVVDVNSGETPGNAESYERTKEEFFEFFLGLILGRVVLVVVAFALFGQAI